MSFSFRTKITLWTLGISGSVLILCGWVFWNVVYSEWERSMDRNIRAFIQRHAMRIHSPRERERLNEVLESYYGESGADTILYWVRDEDQGELLRSTDWPDELDPVNLRYDRSQARRLELLDQLIQPPPGPPDLGNQGEFAPRNRPGPGQGLGPGPGRRLREQLGPRRFGPGEETLPEDLEDRGRRLRGRDRFSVPMEPLIIRTVSTSSTQWRIGIARFEGLTFGFGVNLNRFNEEIHRIRNRIAFAFGGALLLIGLGGWFIAAKAIRPLQRIRATAEKVTATGLDQRIHDTGEDQEISGLIQVLNQMMERLERSFHQAMRFSADASHELKTPLTIMQGELESALQHATPGSDHQQLLTNLLDETQRLKSITRSLLLLSQADAGQLKLHLERVHLSQMIEDVLEDASILAEGMNLEIRQHIQPGCYVDADATLMNTVLINLVSNAVKYNQENGWLELELVETDGAYRVRVMNSGPGIPEDQQSKIFERFYRSDTARSRKVDGLGLGLSLSTEILRAHRSTLRLVESRPDWTCFEFLIYEF